MTTDIRTDIMTDEQYQENCFQFASFAFAVPPDEFRFHHYDEPANKLLICRRPMIGLERYQVDDEHGGFYGLYNTKDVMKYITTKTWIVVESKEFFANAEIERLQKRINEIKKELATNKE